MFNRISLIINGYFHWFLYYICISYRRKIKQEANRRMRICNKCEHYNKMLGICEVCGCFMNVKTKMIFPLDEEGISIDGCWVRKW